jgi:hypothetical protein
MRPDTVCEIFADQSRVPRIHKSFMLGFHPYKCLPLPCLFLANGRRTGAHDTHGFDIHLQLLAGASQGVAVHAQLPGGSNLIPFLVSQNGNDEDLLTFPHCFGLRNGATVHLHDETLKLFPHVSSSRRKARRSAR